MASFLPTFGHRRFGHRVKHYRLLRKYTQEELGLLIGVDNSYIGMIERAQKNVTLDKILKLATALNVKPSELFQ